MKKWLFALAVLLCALAAGSALADVLIDDTRFPNEHFRSYIRQFDTDQNGKLSDAEIEAVENINVSNMEIDTLGGIEYFTSLQYLDCGGNELTELDVSALKSLISLDCDWNKLTSLNVTGLSALTDITCDHNPLTSLDVTQCESLVYLECEYCRITSLNLSHCPNLGSLYAKYNDLGSVIVGPHEGLGHLDVEGNRLTTLDVSGNPHIWRMCVSRNNLTHLTLGEIPYLISLNADENNLLSLDLSGVPNLRFLGLDLNDLTELDISPCPNIERLRIPEFYEHNDYSHYYIYYAWMFGGDPDPWFSCDDDVRIISAGMPRYAQPETDIQETYAYLSPLDITITSNTTANGFVWISDEGDLRACQMFDGWEYEPGVTTHTLYMGKDEYGNPYQYLQPGAYEATVFLYDNNHVYTPFHYHFQVINYYLPQAEWHLSTRRPNDQEPFDLVLSKQYDTVKIKLSYYDDYGDPWEAPEGHTPLNEELIFENTDRVSLRLTRTGWYSLDLTCQKNGDWTEPLSESFCVMEWQYVPEPDIVLPDDLSRIEDGAFQGVQNVVIRIPESVEYISDSAFDPSVTLLVPLDTDVYWMCYGLDVTLIGY